MDTRPALKLVATLSEADFLGGPDRTDDLDIDVIFAKTFDADVADWLVMVSYGDLADWQAATEVAFPCLEILQRVGDVSIVAALDADGCPCGVMAVRPEGNGLAVVGAYIGSDICVRPDMRRSGIGTALVVHRFLYDVGLPTWDLDAAAYSPAGHAVHVAAYGTLLDLQIAQTPEDEFPASGTTADVSPEI